MPNVRDAKLFIVHWNRPKQCAESVRAFRSQGIREIVVIDNASTPENLSSLRDILGDSAEVVSLNNNRGWGPALNGVLEQWLTSSTHMYCLISAHDADPKPLCIDRLLDAFEIDPRLGIACPQYPDRTVAQLSLLHGVKQVAGEETTGRLQLVDLPHGTLMAIRRECLSQCGLFDERFFAYGDEHELGLRARRYGWHVGIVWGATVENPETSTTAATREYLFSRNSLLLAEVYRGRPAAALRAIVILGKSFGKDADGAELSKARSRGVRDYFTRNFGPPR